MNGLAMGLLAVIAGAMMQGSFALPQKFVRNWPWEKSWLFYSISGMVLFPWLLVALVVPNPAQAYANAGPGVLALTAIFGAGWGIGSVLFGLGIAALGVALGFAIIISLTAALGALVPMAVLEPAKFWGSPERCWSSGWWWSSPAWRCAPRPARSKTPARPPAGSASSRAGWPSASPRALPRRC